MQCEAAQSRLKFASDDVWDMLRILVVAIVLQPAAWDWRWLGGCFYPFGANGSIGMQQKVAYKYPACSLVGFIGRDGIPNVCLDSILLAPSLAKLVMLPDEVRALLASSPPVPVQPKHLPATDPSLATEIMPAPPPTSFLFPPPNSHHRKPPTVLSYLPMLDPGSTYVNGISLSLSDGGTIAPAGDMDDHRKKKRSRSQKPLVSSSLYVKFHAYVLTRLLLALCAYLLCPVSVQCTSKAAN